VLGTELAPPARPGPRQQEACQPWLGMKPAGSKYRAKRYLARHLLRRRRPAPRRRRRAAAAPDGDSRAKRA